MAMRGLTNSIASASASTAANRPTDAATEQQTSQQVDADGGQRTHEHPRHAIRRRRCRPRRCSRCRHRSRRQGSGCGRTVGRSGCVSMTAATGTNGSGTSMNTESPCGVDRIDHVDRGRPVPLAEHMRQVGDVVPEHIRDRARHLEVARGRRALVGDLDALEGRSGSDEEGRLAGSVRAPRPCLRRRHRGRCGRSGRAWWTRGTRHPRACSPRRTGTSPSDTRDAGQRPSSMRSWMLPMVAWSSQPGDGDLRCVVPEPLLDRLGGLAELSARVPATAAGSTDVGGPGEHQGGARDLVDVRRSRDAGCPQRVARERVERGQRTTGAQHHQRLLADRDALRREGQARGQLLRPGPGRRSGMAFIGSSRGRSSSWVVSSVASVPDCPAR